MHPTIHTHCTVFASPIAKFDCVVSLFLTSLSCFLEMKKTIFRDMGLLSVEKRMLQVGYFKGSCRGIPISRTSRGNENWFEKSGEGGGGGDRNVPGGLRNGNSTWCFNTSLLVQKWHTRSTTKPPRFKPYTVPCLWIIAIARRCLF